MLHSLIKYVNLKNKLENKSVNDNDKIANVAKEVSCFSDI
jgi:hypothetical protein